jgi:hypothetical protein
MLIALLGAIVLTSLGWQFATSPHLQFDCPPRDEATRDQELVAFRARLRQAVARKDAVGVLALTSAEIRTSFGPEDGLEFFKRDLANKRSEIWDELRTVLALGGVFETPETFVAPFLLGCGEPGEEVVVVGRDVRVRSHPRPTAPVLSVVSFAILRQGDDRGTPNWEPVQLRDGRHGFIAARFVRSPIGYRAHFAKVNAVWKLVAFIGGD